jgi:glutamine amidotransferase-like uncharacterized protein
MSIFLRRFFLVLIFILFSIAIIFISSRNSTNFDESANIVAGISIWKYGGCFELYPVNPPLVKFISAIPLLFCQPDIDWKKFDDYLDHHEVGSRPEFDVALSMVRRNSVHIQFYVFLSRLFCIPFALLGAYFCWRWSTDLYGQRAGFAALILWCSSPSILTWSSFVMSDMAAASCGVMFCYLFWKWTKKSEWPQIFYLSIAFGCTLLTKFTWIILFPILPLLWLAVYYSGTVKRTWYIFRDQLFQLICVMAAGIFVLNLGYGFEDFGRPLGDFKFASRTLAGDASIIISKNTEVGNRFADSIVANVPVILPANYLIGVDLQKVDFERGIPSYLNGTWSEHGWWYFYIECLLIKSPVGTLGLAFLAVVCSLFNLRCKNRIFVLFDELLLLAPAIIFFIFVSSQTGFSRHFRYVLPTLPFFFIAVSKVFEIAFERSYFSRIAVCSLLFCTIIATLSIFPHTMSFFNIIAGGARQGHHYLLDSNLDWGQDTLAFKKWLTQHPEIKGIHVKMRDRISDSFFLMNNYPTVPYSPADKPIGIFGENDDSDFNYQAPLPGWYAISVQQIMAQHHRYRYLLDLKPKYMIGYSIYIYHITLEQANLLRKKYNMPEIEKPVNNPTLFFDNLNVNRKKCNCLNIAIYVKNDTAIDLNVKRILDNEPSFSWQPITAQQIRDGEIGRFDVIIFAGGSGTEMWQNLESDGRKHVRNFIKNGGGYLGICAGAFLASTGKTGLGLINADVVTGQVYITGFGYVDAAVRVADDVDLELTDFGCQLFDKSAQKILPSIPYRGGPIFKQAHRDYLPEFITLATFKTETAIHDFQRNTMINSPAIIVAQYGNGAASAISPHLEFEPKYDDMIKKIIQATAKK